MTLSEDPALKTQAIVGCLLGTAVGDAMGLPYEGLSKQRLRKKVATIDRHRLVWGKGMVSDDTEQTCMVAQALIAAGGSELKFGRALAWRLRFWFLALPAGVGKATAIACVKLWLGFKRPGTFLAGNGAAMRSSILGVCYGGDRERLELWVRASTRLTHSDPKAEYGAIAVALAAHLASTQVEIVPTAYYQALQETLEPKAQEFLQLIERACDSAERRETGETFADALGARRGVSGYIYRTVPVVLQIWLRHQRDYRAAIAEVIQLGGDTDTTAAILGGIIGARVGKAGIPPAWLENIWEFPRSLRWIESLGKRLAIAIRDGSPQPALPLSIPGLLLRNLLFLSIVLGHGFLRLLPPYR